MFRDFVMNKDALNEFPGAWPMLHGEFDYSDVGDNVLFVTL